MKEFELTWSWKSFENLSKEEVYEILSFRQSIFVVEQESWYLDADALDQESEHLIVKYKDKLIGFKKLLDQVEYPCLMHCKSGADRAGLAAFIPYI